MTMATYWAFLSCLLVGTCVGFLGNAPFLVQRRKEYWTCLDLIPIQKFRSDFKFLDESDEHRCSFDRNGTLQIGNDDVPPFQLCLVEEEDLPDVARFVVNAFGSDVISLSKDFNRFEQALMKPTIGLLNAYSGLVAYAEVLSGLQSRTKGRIENPNLDPPDLSGKTREEKLQEAAKSSLVLAVGRPSQGSDWHIDVIASVELRLEPCDAKIPFSFPFLDRIERRLASLLGVGETDRSLRPYLSNLCVDKSFRGKQIGKGLVRCVEDITETWGYEKLYLHVDLENEGARTLYQNAGYKDVGRRWKPFWAGPAAKIGYYCRKIKDGRSRSRSTRLAKVKKKRQVKQRTLE